MKSGTGSLKFVGVCLCSVALVLSASITSFGRVAVYSPQHLDDANALVNVIKTSANNKYDDDGISNSYINWDGSSAWSNCSTFVTLLLKRSYNLTDTDFLNRWNSTSPTAASFHDQIEAQNYFTRVFYRSHIQAGDFIAIKYPSGASATGHMMLVAGAPTLRTAVNPIIADTTQYEVPVIDSSSSYHGSTDTRHPNNNGGGEGIGKGVFRIYVDANDQIVGYTWSTYSNSTYYTQAQRHLVVGRLQQ